MSKTLTIDIILKTDGLQRPVRFSAQPGITALIGPSGSGKTTTLNYIAGLANPQTGVIVFGDEVWFDSSKNINRRAQDRRPGYVFQNSALFPHLSVSDNVSFALRKEAEPLRQARLEALSATFELQPFLARKPSQLSGGQAQRVALARALAHRPQLLLLDEPLNALDRQARDDIAVKLKSLQKEHGLTVIFVTHFLEESAGLADFVVDMEQAV